VEGYALNVQRRRFLHLGGIGAVALLAGCGDDEENQGVGPISGERATGPGDEHAGEGSHDITVLNEALDFEHQSVAAYTAAARALTGPAAVAARRFRDHEREHAQTLARVLRDLGAKPNAARESYAFPRLREQAQVLRFAEAMENAAIAKYIDSIPRLNDPEVRATGASIMANEAEHLAVLHQQLGERTVPEPFVEGERGEGV
jgi:rubrerythrin